MSDSPTETDMAAMSADASALADRLIRPLANRYLCVLAAIAAIIVELGGSIMLIVGWNARLAAAAMFVFTAMTALFFHNFWAVPADQAQDLMIHFMKNISMMGGLLYVVVHGSGPLSLNHKKRN